MLKVGKSEGNSCEDIEPRSCSFQTSRITYNVDKTLICSSHKIGRSCFSAGEVEVAPENPEISERKSILLLVL